MMKGLAGARVLLWFEILISLAYSRYIRKALGKRGKGLFLLDLEARAQYGLGRVN